MKTNKTNPNAEHECPLCEEYLVLHRGGTMNDEKTGDFIYVYVCEECSKFLVNHLSSHYPKSCDVPYLFYLLTSKEGDKNIESNRIQNEMEELIKRTQGGSE